MNDFIIEFKKYIVKIKLSILIFYYKMLFLLNKQRIIQKMYEPLISRKNTANKNLLKSLTSLNLENESINDNIKKLIKKNQNLKNTISIMQELLIKKNF